MRKVLPIIGLFLGAFAPSLGADCGSIYGKWYNQWGSELILDGIEPATLYGELRTAVEKTPGSAGNNHTNVKGLSGNANTGVLLAFSGVFNEGGSVASWLGQCLKCGDEELLQTTWLLKEAVSSCKNHWRSTLIGEDLFVRQDGVPGPRRDQGYHVPIRPNWDAQDGPLAPVQNTSPNNLSGKWYTADGIILDLSIDDIVGTITGEYRSDDGSSMAVTGTYSPLNPVGGFGLQAIDRDAKMAYVWVGQQQRCENGKEVLETSWLRRKAVESCARDLTATNFGKMTFVRTPVSGSDGGGNNWQISSMFSNMASKISNFFSNLFSS